jgi:hypothetical protein
LLTLHCRHHRDRRNIVDANRFDRLTRRLTTHHASRRCILAAPAAALGAGLIGAAGIDAKKRCKNSKRCGKDCCSQDYCFPNKKINPHDPDDVTPGCCPAKSLCLAPEGDTNGDQCCYSDEKCNPGGNNNGNGLCCRTCGGECCASAQVCKNGKCKILNTARLPRRRP